MDGVKKKINFDPALLYYPNKSDELERKAITVGNTETYNNSNRKHGCNICGKRFFTISSLNSHMEHHTLDEQKSVNEEDDNWKDRRTLKKGIELKCSKSECNFLAFDAVEVQEHLNICEGKRLTKENSPAFCEKCENYFTSTNYLKAHSVLKHSEGCSDISLNACSLKQIVNDPVCLYISENTENNSKNRTMYPGTDSSGLKKKMKESESDNLPPKTTKKTPSGNEIKGDETINNSNATSLNENSLSITNGMHNVEHQIVSCDESEKQPESIIEKSCDNGNIDESEKTSMNSHVDFNVSKKNIEENQTNENIDSSQISCVLQNDQEIHEFPLEFSLKDNVVNGVQEVHGDLENPDEGAKDYIVMQSMKVDGVNMDVGIYEDKNIESKLSDIVNHVNSAENGILCTVFNETSSNSDEKNKANVIIESKPINTPLKPLENSENNRNSNKNEGSISNQIFEINSKVKSENEIKNNLTNADDKHKKKIDASNSEKSITNINNNPLLNSACSQMPIGKIPKESSNPSEKSSIKGITNHSTPKIENPKETIASTSFKAGNESTGEKKKRTRKRRVITSLNSNLKDRSIRSRKKLMLPDFEYSFEAKFDRDESADESSVSESKSFLDESFSKSESSFSQTPGSVNTLRKRGRPRKNPQVPQDTVTFSTHSAKSTTEVKEEVKILSKNITKNPAVLGSTTSSSVYSTESVAEINEEAEIFSLTTTILEPEQEISMNSKNQDDQKNDDETWLSNIDFSEGQSLVDSWGEQPKKKLGRPPKKRKKLLKKPEPSTRTLNSDPTQSDKKKRGRPKKNCTAWADDETIVDISVENIECNEEDIFEVTTLDDGQEDSKKSEESVRSSETTDVKDDQGNENETMLTENSSESAIAVRKRGRPSKVKSVISTSTSSIAVIDDENESSVTDNVKENTTDEQKQPALAASSQSVDGILKKRGRPRKSVDQIMNKEMKEEIDMDVEMKAESDVEESEPVQCSAEATQMQMKKEFMEYIRIKEDVDDSDHEPSGKKSNSSNLVSPPKKRGRPRLDEMARKRAAAAESMKSKNDRPYSIYNKYNAASESLCKRRRDPLHTLELLKIRRNKKRKLLDDAKEASNTNLSTEVSSSDNLQKTVSSESTSDVPQTSSSVGDDEVKCSTSTSAESELPYVIKKTGQGRPKKVNKLKVKKSRDSSPQIIETFDDETKNVDPELYLMDIRNRAKYSRIFKKVREVPKHDEYFPSSLVTCGRCKKLMTLRHYHLNHQVSHYFLCWLDGEEPLDFTIDTDLIRIMQQYVNPDALRKKLIKLHCEQCHKVMKSVVGYVSHIRFCSKMNEEEFLSSCVLCGKKLKPSSLRHHYVKTHNIPLPNVNAKTKEELLMGVTSDSLSRSDAILSSLSNSSSSSAKKPPKSFLNFERKGVDKSDIINDEKFWTLLKTSYDLYMCMGLNCRHMTLSKEDLKNHILNCHAAFCEFNCLLCSFRTRYESEIIYHTKNSCKDFSDTEEKADEEMNVSTDGRRVSNRVKKRRYRYDDEFFDNNDRRKSKDDDDFEPSEEDEDDHEFVIDSDDDMFQIKSRSNKRKSGLYSSHRSTDSSLRIAFLNHNSTRQYDSLSWTVETRLKMFNTSPILKELKVDEQNWMTPLSDFSMYYPKQVKSMKVSFENKIFTEYDLFQSDVVKGVPISYCGGPVWALAWAPLPAQVPEQYLAVSGLRHMNQLLELNSSVKFPSVVQIWKYNSLDNISNTIDQPFLYLAIAHDYGAVSCMEWCPSGGFDDESSDVCRLGILALATSAGCVIVYSIPRLDPSDDPKTLTTKPEPDLILSVKCSDVQCTRVVWLRKKEQGVICAGFSNGTVALWNISCESSLFRNKNIVYPFRTFEAHNASIIALDAHWLDNGRYLLTSSIDRIMKYWDLEDLSGPLNEQEGSSPIMNVAWLQQWAVSAAGYDCLNVVDPSTSINHTRDTIDRKRNIANLRDTCWSVAYSDWNDTVALSLCSGQVSVYAAKHMSVLTYKQPDFEKVVTETSLLPLNDDDKDMPEKECVEERTGLPETKTSYDVTTVLQEFGLQFCDRVKNKTAVAKSGFTPDCCNVMSINKVCWNQNYNSFNWLAVGYESGFVRVFRVERFDKLHLTKFYKMNENSNITSI